MNIQKIYEKMLNGEEVEFSVAESNEDRQKWAKCEKNLLCRLSFEGHNGTVLLRSASSSTPFCFTGPSVKLKTFSPEGFIDLTVSPKTQVLIHHNNEIAGEIREMEFKMNNGTSQLFIYEISGGGIEDKYMGLQLESYDSIFWKKEYPYEGETIDAQFSFRLGDQCVTVDLSREIDLDSSVYREILDKILVLVEMISFCKSAKAELMTERALSGENINYSRYIKPQSQDIGFANLICPMRNDTDMWFDFLHCVMQQENVTYQWLIDSGLFQAIGNLYFYNINEWMLIKLAAALEGLCKTPEVDLFEGKEELKKYKSARDKAIEAIKRQGEQKDISEYVIKQLIKNIHDNKRQLIGYPTKWYVEMTLCECNIKGYLDQHLRSITDAINMRNTIVHTGWAKEWKTGLMEHIKILRNTIFLIVLARLEYPGEFYFSGDEHKQPTCLREWQF